MDRAEHLQGLPGIRDGGSDERLFDRTFLALRVPGCQIPGGRHHILIIFDLLVLDPDPVPYGAPGNVVEPAGDKSVWHQTKPIKQLPGCFRIRIGRDYRLMGGKGRKRFGSSTVSIDRGWNPGSIAALAREGKFYQEEINRKGPYRARRGPDFIDYLLKRLVAVLLVVSGKSGIIFCKGPGK
jgi:hypothetical protein